jgi:Glutaredoxin and related proteins
MGRLIPLLKPVTPMSSPSRKTAIVHRMVIPDHICPYGRKAIWLLKSKGYAVEDHHLTTREQTDAFKAQHGVRTTPQVFIDGQRIGGYDDLRRWFGQRVPEPGATSYTPVLVVFAVGLLIALAIDWLMKGSVGGSVLPHFIAVTMMLLAMLKLQDVEKFSTMFLNYDLLAQRWPPYGYIYPFAELTAGSLMLAGILSGFSAPLALLIGGIGAVSVFKAVYVDKRQLKCACVGGASNVPLGFVSLSENLMMIAMAVWMLSPLAAHG